MCILFAAIKQHPDFPLIICANRDEYYQRPTAAADWWTTDNQLEPEILAGKDLEAGGTWLGVNRKRQFSAVTNIRGVNYSNQNPVSRGKLVTNTLSMLNTKSADKIAADLEISSDRYRPFSLWFGGQEGLTQFNSVTQETNTLSCGFHALSNSRSNEYWPKMSSGIQKLRHLIQTQPQISVGNLLLLLEDDTQAVDHLLPNTGIDYRWEKKLSSIFIRGQDYGTRSSTILLFDSNDKVTFFERRYHSGGPILDDREFTLPKI